MLVQATSKNEAEIAARLISASNLEAIPNIVANFNRKFVKKAVKGLTTGSIQIILRTIWKTLVDKT